MLHRCSSLGTRFVVWVVSGGLGDELSEIGFIHGHPQENGF